MLKTRKQYLAGEISHDDYYAQFITLMLVWAVNRIIGSERIRASSDQSFNDIPLSEWGTIHSTAFVDVLKLQKTAGYENPRQYDDGKVENVCLAKRAARYIKNKETFLGVIEWKH